jgi:hypothetical protein
MPVGIDAQDRQKISDLVQKLYAELIKPLDRTITEVFRYTDGAGLKGILTENRIRATNVAYVNDAKEYQHSIDRFLEILDSYKKAHANIKPGKAILATLEERIHAADEVQPVWVACFSTRGDDLSQWRGYGMGEGGYSIGFDAAKLSEVCRVNNGPVCMLMPCIYEPLGR